MAASISFFAILSFLPFVILTVSVTSFFVASSDVAYEKILEYLNHIFPVTTIDAVGLLTTTIAKKAIFGLVGLFGLIWAATKVFTQLEHSMNVIWRTGSERSFWHSRFIALISIPSMTVFLLLSLLVTGFISVARTTTVPLLGISFNELPLAGNILTFLVPTILSTVLFFIVYYFLPKRWEHFRYALYGALLAGGLWEAAKILFDRYIKEFSHLQTLYGSFTSLAILLLWVYYSAFLILFGAEFGSLIRERRREKRRRLESESDE